MTKKFQKNMRGLAHIQLALIIAVIIAVVGLAAWKVQNNSSGPATGINKEVQDKCKTVVNDDLFCKFAGSFGNVGDYKVAVNSTDQKGTSTIELANDSKGNSSMVVKQNDQEQGNIVVLGGVTYLKDYTDGKWFKYGPNDANKPEPLDLKKEFLKGDFKGDNGQKLEYKKIGTEKCDKLTCYKYQVIDSQKSTETSFVWFDTKDYLLRRATVNDSTANTSAEMTITYTSVAIAQPSPTKDIPSAETSE